MAQTEEHKGAGGIELRKIDKWGRLYLGRDTDMLFILRGFILCPFNYLMNAFLNGISVNQN